MAAAAASTAASAAQNGPDEVNQARQSTTYNQIAQSSATSTSNFTNNNTQHGLAPLNVTAGNFSYSEANAVTQQEAPKFFKDFGGNFARFGK